MNTFFDRMPRTIPLSDWIRLHRPDLHQEYTTAISQGLPKKSHEKCLGCCGSGSVRDDEDMLVECDECCGYGIVECSEEDNFLNFCYDLYYEQLSRDSQKYRGYIKFMESEGMVNFTKD